MRQQTYLQQYSDRKKCSSAGLAGIYHSAITTRNTDARTIQSDPNKTSSACHSRANALYPVGDDPVLLACLRSPQQSRVSTSRLRPEADEAVEKSTINSTNAYFHQRALILLDVVERLAHHQPSMAHTLVLPTATILPILPADICAFLSVEVLLAPALS